MNSNLRLVRRSRSSGPQRSLTIVADQNETVAATGECSTKRFAGFVALLMLFALTLYAIDVQRGGGVDFAGLMAGQDFVNIHFGGGLIAEGRLETLADQDAYFSALRGWAGPDYPVHNWSYPPLMFLPAEGFASLPYPIALALWSGLGCAAIAVAVRYAGLGTGWAALICLSPAGLVNLLAGQNGFFTSAFTVAGVIATVHRQSLIAGANWALLTIKPHLGVMVLPWLVCRGETRVILYGSLLFSSILCVSLLIYGIGPWIAFFDRIAPQQKWVLETWAGRLEVLIPTLFMQARSAGLGSTSAYFLHASGALLAVLLLVRAWPEHTARPREWLAWLVCGTYLILPYSFVYDLVIFQVMLALWHDTPERMLRMGQAVLARGIWMCLWMLPQLSIFIMGKAGVQIIPLVLLALLWRLGCTQRDSAGK